MTAVAYGIAFPAGRGILTPQRYSAQAEAFFARLATQPAQSRKQLYDALIRALVSSAVWSKLDALYVFAAADQATALTNLVRSSYAATAVNSPVFTVDRGYTGANTKYIDTSFNPSAGGTNFVQDSATIGGWSLTSSQSDAYIVGTNIGGGAGDCRISPRTTTNIATALVNYAGPFVSVPSITDGSGWYAATRSSSSRQDLYKNGSSIGSQSSGPSSLGPGAMYFLRDGSTYDTRQIAAGVIASALSTADHANLYSALRGYMTGVGVP